MKHAATTRYGYTVPLIGIPANATDEQCSRCKQYVHLREIVLDEHGNPICLKCLTNKNQTIKSND